MAHVIQAEQLTRYFGSVKAVDGVTFGVEQGEVFGVLGPNGAGKTTTVRLINGVLAPSAGKACVLGLAPATQGCDVRRHTGVLAETPSLYERLTARDNLLFFGALYSVPQAELPTRVNDLLEFFGLSERADDKVGGFSKGMRQRLALGRALIHEPPLLFLDEPTAGLDPEAARQVTELIERLSHQGGRTVFLCTHNLAEAQRLCDRVAVMNRGHLLALGTPAQLAHELWRGLWVDFELRTAPRAGLLDELRAVQGIKDVVLDDVHLAVQVSNEEMIPAVVAEVAGRGGQVLRVNPRQHSLEEVYFELQRRQAAQASVPARKSEESTSRAGEEEVTR